MAQSIDSNLFTVPLAEQAEGLIAAIRKAPADVRLRVHYAQLCMVMGDWERAVSQLQAAAQLAPSVIPMAHAYREAIRCERVRERVFEGELQAGFLGEQPEEWLVLLAQSLASRANGDAANADELHARAYEGASECSFAIDGLAVDWIADADSRLGPVCELFLNGQYCWVPFASILRMEIDAPQDLRDLVWLPAHLTLQDGAQHPVLLPSRYPASYRNGKDALALASLTEWHSCGKDLWAGAGQRMLASSESDHPLLSLRQLSCQVVHP